MSASSMINRRRVLRGMMAGSAVSVGLPILDSMLNENGNAFADTGRELPTIFSTWFWGLGFGEGVWVPKTAGRDYELPTPMEALKPLKSKFNFYSGMEVYLEGKVNETHFTGAQGLMTGRVGNSREYSGSLDTIIGDHLGGGTRFKSIEVTCAGDAKATWSAPAGSGKKPAETSPLALYTRIFGEEFKDPNAADFTPDPLVMARKSALSAVTDQRQALMSRLGAADRAKLDYYFTSLRSLEEKLAIQLEKPQPLPACTKPGAPDKEAQQGITLLEDGMARHDLFTELLVHALACGQTRVTNLTITEGMSGFRLPGQTSSHHSLTHEEPVDSVLGYQKECAVFQVAYMKALARYITAMEKIKEGDKSMLDRMLVFAFTDHGAPRLHSVRNYPLMTFGGANGRHKTGMHIPRPSDQITRIGLTAQLIMGVPVNTWGVGANRATNPISEVMA
jgi:hypothetical protein